MRRIMMIGIVSLSAVLVSACGASTGSFAGKPPPPQPIAITGQISNTRVHISPTRFGAGPVDLEVTNAASRSVSLAVQDASGHLVARVQSINPQTPGEVKLDLAPGKYIVLASQPSIKPAELHVGNERASTANSLLQP